MKHRAKAGAIAVLAAVPLLGTAGAAAEGTAAHGCEFSGASMICQFESSPGRRPADEQGEPVRSSSSVTWGKRMPGRGERTADLSVRIIGPAQARPRREILYVVTVRNDGPAKARDVLVRSVLPEGRSRAEHVGGITSCTRTESVLACALGTLDAQEERTLLIRLRPPNGVRPGTVLEPSASVTTSTYELNPANNQARARTTVAADAAARTVRRP
ncbi:hypothetical protein GCM10010191_26200 [Actinomadura vinacea]|uniref:DUF11 domain-containing protein n=1 Tax=Actinomadura vinacea TaxID=115336 RepID=A0ABN3IX30_9ACTN